MDRRDPAIGFIGAGALGKGLAWALAAKGYRVLAAYSRSRSSAEDLVRRIPGCRTMSSAQELSDAVELSVYHHAGRRNWRGSRVGNVETWTGSCALLRRGVYGIAGACYGAGGSQQGAFHPFQTFGGVTSARSQAEQRLPEKLPSPCLGRDGLMDFLWEMASRFGGRPVSIPDADRPLYHASAILACGHVTALLRAAVEVWRTMGFTEREAMRSLYPLCRATLEAVAAQGTTAAATGPVVRGDGDTIRTHLDALSSRLPALSPVYAALAAAALPLAADRGVDPGRIADMKELIDRYADGVATVPSGEGHRL